MDLGMNEILLVLVVALLVYGDRLPQVARSLGRTLASLKRTIAESSAAVTREMEAATSPPDEDEDEAVRPRTVRRIPQPAPEDLAKEDITQREEAAKGPAGDGPPARGADGGGAPTAG
jgi:Sec-independent protein translocase protein TatA